MKVESPKLHLDNQHYKSLCFPALKIMQLLCTITYITAKNTDSPTVKESYSFTAMSHSGVHSAQGQKMRSLVRMLFLQVVQYVYSLKQHWVQKIFSFAFGGTDENTEVNHLPPSM